MSDLDNNARRINETEQPTLDVLLAGLFYLMNQYTFHQCPRIADKVVEHLAMLCNHPQIVLMPSQNYLFAKMINVWRARQFGNKSGLDAMQLH